MAEIQYLTFHKLIAQEIFKNDFGHLPENPRRVAVSKFLLFMHISRSSFSEHILEIFITTQANYVKIMSLLLHAKLPILRAMYCQQSETRNYYVNVAPHTLRI